MMPERRRPSGLGRRYPGLLIALGVDPVAYYESNGYIIGEQGKPPDFVLEVASASTADEDTGRGVPAVPLVLLGVAPSVHNRRVRKAVNRQIAKEKNRCNALNSWT